jgi:hypothetical protein
VLFRLRRPSSNCEREAERERGQRIERGGGGGSGGVCVYIVCRDRAPPPPQTGEMFPETGLPEWGGGGVYSQQTIAER